MTFEAIEALRRTKQPCPYCNRKGLHYCDHPHAHGYKDYHRVRCRWCKAEWHNTRAIRQEREWLKANPVSTPTP